MSPAPVRGRPPRDLEAPRDLARGWYVAERSTRVGRRPRPAVVAGTEVVVWRTGDGAAVVMDRFCPHQGAALELGRVVDGDLRCAFHHWRFDGEGTCVAAPSTRRVPRGTTARVHPSWEGLGYVWTWRGSAVPEYPPPDFPHLGPAAPAHRRYRFAFDTNATARRVLENGFDLPHFPVVHGIAGDLRLTWDAEENKHTMGARITTDSIALPAPLDRRPGGLGRLCLHLRSTPSYQVLTFELDDRPVAHELLAVTPVARDRTTMHGWTVVPRAGGLLGSAPVFWAYRLQHWWGTRADLRIYRDAEETDGSINTPDDEGVLRFRQFHRHWTGRGPR
ncbi:Rieske 2Fe-2S domain-containing protein [Streptomyces sp. NPDC005549]|uniref:Rieske 2Fe-2S domain-containing protein n=1 Tax=Streptomyces sp. NPDC005549 TaxID=3154888 RepID=UPI0033BE3095